MKAISLFSIVFASIFSLSIVRNNQVFEAKATEPEVIKTLHFDVDNNVLSTNTSNTGGNAINSCSENIAFSFYNLSHVSRGAGANWQTFYSSSYLQNTTPLPSLKNISFKFLNTSESSINFFWGWDGPNETYTSHTINCEALTASFNFNDERPSFFKMLTQSEISITEMEISYGVETTDDIYGTLPYLEYNTLSDGTISVKKVTNTSLTTIYIPEYIDGKEVSEILSGAITNCGRLERLIIPFVGNAKSKEGIAANSPLNLFAYIFGSSSGSDYVSLTQICEINYNSGGSDLLYTRKISKRLSFLKVLAGDLGYGSLSGITTIQTIELGERVSNTIPIGTFYKSNITFLRLPSHLKSFDRMAFKDSSIETLFLTNTYKEWAVKSFLTDTSCPIRYSSLTYFNGETVSEMHFTDVENISGYAFYGLNSLTKVTIDGSVKKINISFPYCTNLIEASIDIEGYVGPAFQYCSSLKKCVISERATGLGNQMFAGCSSLEELRLPFVVYTIGFLFGTTAYDNSVECVQSVNSTSSEYKYQIPAPLKKISVGGSLIVSCAFKNMTMLEEVILGDDITLIEYQAFQNCTGLKHLHIGKNVDSISSTAFIGSHIELITVDDENITYQSLDNGKILYSTATDYLVFSCNYVIPEGTVEFSTSAFSGNTEIETIYIPASVTKIPDKAFMGCSNLKNVIFAENSRLERIGNHAFKNCTSLLSITLPRGLQYLGECAFSHDSALESVAFEVGSQFKGNGQATFEYCTSLKTFAFPNSGLQTGIVSNTFLGCEQLETVYIPDSVKSIGGGAFYNCTSLKNIDIPRGVTFIGEMAFYNCSSLEKLVIPASVNTIELYAFFDDLNLTIYFEGSTLPESCDANWNSSSCPVFFDYGIPSENEEYEYTILYNDTIMLTKYKGTIDSSGTLVVPSVVDGHNVYKIASGFIDGSNCISLVSLIISDGIEAIQNNAFANCSNLYNLILGKDIKAIDEEAFLNCNKIVGASDGVFYKGSSIEEWESISGASSVFSTQTIYFYSQTEPSEDGNNYWYYTVNSNTYVIHDWANTFTIDLELSNCVTYSVKFINYDGSVLLEQSYIYGDTISVPSNPTRPSDNIYNYTFVGWDKDISSICTGNVTYTAQYSNEYREYTITFLDENGNIISSGTYHYGDNVAIPVPTKESDNTYNYTFSGWDTSVSETCDGDATYTATFSSSYIEYTVTFIDYDGTVISVQTYHYGDTISVPSNPTRPSDNIYSYTFSGWDKDISLICTENITYTAQYSSEYSIEYKSAILRDQLINEIDNIENVDLSTYLTILDIQSRMEKLTANDKVIVQAKLDSLIQQYNNFVSGINSEFNTSERIFENLLFGAVATISGLIYGLMLIIKRRFLL